VKEDVMTLTFIIYDYIILEAKIKIACHDELVAGWFKINYEGEYSITIRAIIQGPW
jgi:hypothetical protein